MSEVRAKQSRLGSFAESLANLGFGFLFSMAIWHFIVAPIWGLPNDAATNFWITMIYTVASIVRSYSIRRFVEWTADGV